PGDRSGRLEHLHERDPVVGRLPDRLVEQDHAADVLAEPRGREQHLSIASARVLGRSDPDLIEPLLDRAGRLVGGEDALARGDQLASGRVHRVTHDVTSRMSVPFPHGATAPLRASVARSAVPRPRPKTRLRGDRHDVDASAMRKWVSTSLQMSWLATALAVV